MCRILLIILIFFSSNIFAEPAVINCKGKDNSKWTNCFGALSKNGTTYVGNFLKGKMHGKGTFTYSDGATYFGDFRNGKESGEGTFICWAHGAKYEGAFKNGLKHGKGSYNYPDGATYVGDWEYGKRHGTGVYTFANGEKMIGEFREDKYQKNSNDG